MTFVDSTAQKCADGNSSGKMELIDGPGVPSYPLKSLIRCDSLTSTQILARN